MKKFNSLQELWSYCLFCPLCQDMTRKIGVVGSVSQIKKHSKVNQILKIEAEVRILKERYNVTYYIDCVKNTFTISIPKMLVSNEEPVTRSDYPSFHLNLIGICSKCRNTTVHSKYLEVDLLSKKVSNFELQFEDVYLLEHKSKYRLIFDHGAEQLIVHKCIDQDGSIEEDEKSITFPLTHFDFSKPKKVLNRIRTLLVFS